MSNALEAPNEGDWGHTIRRQDFFAIENAGFDTIRLPVAFSAHFDPIHGIIDPQFLARVDQVIKWAIDAGLTVILDLHHFDTLMEQAGPFDRHFIQIWEHLSTHYKGWSEALIFELLNEPNTFLGTEIAETLFDQVFPILRKDHPTRWIITEGGDWADRRHLGALDPRDQRTAHSFHYYDPFLFTHQEADWVDPIPPKRGPIMTEELNQIAKDFATLPQQETPVFLGEFGVSDAAHDTSRALWLQQVRQSAERAGIPWCVWGFANSFGIFDHANGRWNTRLLNALIPEY